MTRQDGGTHGYWPPGRAISPPRGIKGGLRPALASEGWGG